MGLGTQEFLLIPVVITLVFYGKKIKELAIGMGQAVREFRGYIQRTNEEIEIITE